MLAVAAFSLVLGLVVAGYGTAAGAGALVFASGFLLISVIALLSRVRIHHAV